MAQTPKLSTRSYAVLGLLAIRDWTTYELARQMERGIGDIWSAARSMVYEEPKRLVALGLARASTEPIGRRTRTRYAITDAGRAAVQDWLSEPGGPPAMQFEGLLKILLADTDNPHTLDASLRAARDWARELQAVGRQVAAEYLAGRGPFPDRTHVVTLSFAVLWDFSRFIERWATWAETEVAGWPADGAAGPMAPDNVFHRALAGASAVPAGDPPAS